MQDALEKDRDAETCLACCAVNEDEFLESIMHRDLRIWEGGMPDPDHSCSLIRCALAPLYRLLVRR